MVDYTDEYTDEQDQEEQPLEGIAIVGLAGRFPKAENVDVFWDHLLQGVEGISFLDKQAGQADHYVPAGGFLDGIKEFDAHFFGYNIREAQLIDPQQRLFLECAWEALERAGYDSEQYDGRIGVFAGSGANHYFMYNLAPNRELREAVGDIQMMISNEKDYLATRVSYKLGLKGPSLNVQTACSTSLSAIATAVQSLTSYQSDMALAGGISIQRLEPEGYHYEQGGIASSDGHCRAFDADADGCVAGSGVGVVVLKRLEDAVNDGDTIYAVLKGIAVNNDGADKMGFTAPSVEGQVEVIAEAIGLADITADTIGYVEAHGTGTALGDPIEVAALTEAFRQTTDAVQYCAIGSVKTNIGHLDAAAGVTGVIKSALALHHGKIPPTLHYKRPNPQIDFENSPFFVNTDLREWPRTDTPRRAAVSSLGIGGTNVHAVLEEAPMSEASDQSGGPARESHLLLLSAKTATALEKISDNLAAHLTAHPDLDLADVAYTLHAGRRRMKHRRVLVAGDTAEATALLRTRDAKKSPSAAAEGTGRGVAFLFPGQSAQYVNMGQDLYRTEAVYRDVIDFCSESWHSHYGVDIRDLLFPPTGQEEAVAEQMRSPGLGQLALFATELATARLLETWGVTPQAMIGYSLGEFAAAALAGVMSLEDAVYLVGERSRLMQEIPAGAMLTVPVSAEAVAPYLIDGVSIAGANGPHFCVVSGTSDAVHSVQETLALHQIEARLLQTTHAFHSTMMDPAAARFRDIVAQVALHPPTIPYVSCTTGTWITDEQATSPDYWARHIRDTVRFADGVQTLFADSDLVPLEVGPGRQMSTLLKQQPELSGRTPVTTIRHPHETVADDRHLLLAAGRLWLQGVSVEASDLYADQHRRRVLLPTYPFERRVCWIDAVEVAPTLGGTQTLATAEEEAAVTAELLQQPEETSIERRVANVWAELLGEDSIRADDDFFELGGHSLLAIRLMAQLREEFQVELPDKILYQCSTVAALSEAITESVQELTVIRPYDRQGEHPPASWNQKRMVLREFHHPGHPFMTAIGQEYQGSIDRDLLDRALREVVRRHEILRTAFAVENGDVVQVVASDLPDIAVSWIDLTDLPLADRSSEMLRLAREDESTPFDMERPPLWRMTFYVLDGDRLGWFLTAHASIMDGLTVRSMVTEMGIIYEALQKGETWHLPEQTLQYGDYALWERDRFQGETADSALSYWQDKLDREIELVDLPTDFPRHDAQPYGPSDVYACEISPELTERLKSFSQQHSASLYMTMLAAYDILLHRMSGQTDIVTETSFSTRTYPELANVLGPMANFVPIRTDVSGDPTFHEVLERVIDTMRGVIVCRDFPAAKALEVLRPEWYENDCASFRIAFTYYEPGFFPTLPGLSTLQRLWARRAFWNLYTAITEQEDGSLLLASEYDATLYQKDTVAHLFRDYEQLLTALLDAPNKPLSDL